MYLTDKISKAWTALNNLGTGSEKDPLRDHYPSGDLAGKTVRVERDAKNDTTSARDQMLTQYRCRDGAFVASYGEDVVGGVDGLICPKDTKHTPVLCQNPLVTVPQVTFFPYEDTMGPDEGCYYTPGVSRVSAQYMQEVVCPQIPNAKTGVCFSINPNGNDGLTGVIIASSFPIVLGGIAVIGVVAHQIGSLCCRFWGKKEEQEVPTIIETGAQTTTPTLSQRGSAASGSTESSGWLFTANTTSYGAVQNGAGYQETTV